MRWSAGIAPGGMGLPRTSDGTPDRNDDDHLPGLGLDEDEKEFDTEKE